MGSVLSVFLRFPERIKDIAVDDSAHPSVMKVRIKLSPFRRGISLEKTGSLLCPVAAMMDYLRVRGTRKAGPPISLRKWKSSYASAVRGSS